MGDLWRSGRWRHVDDRHRPAQGGHHHRPRPSLARTLNLALALDPPCPPTRPPTQNPSITTSILTSLFARTPKSAQAGIWAPCIGVAPWGILDEELQSGMQAAHENGVAYEVPRRLTRDDVVGGGTSARANNHRGRGLGGGSRDASPVLQRSHQHAANAAVAEAAAHVAATDTRTTTRPKPKRAVGWGAAARTEPKDSLPPAESVPSSEAENRLRFSAGSDGGGGSSSGGDGGGGGDGDGDGDGDSGESGSKEGLRSSNSPEWNRAKVATIRSVAAVRFRGAISLVKAAERMRDGAERERTDGTTFETNPHPNPNPNPNPNPTLNPNPNPNPLH